MALGVGMYQQQQMRQTMMNVPQMIQSQEMLQLPILALEQRISQELLENPALEMVDLEDDDDDWDVAEDAPKDRVERESDAGDTAADTESNSDFEAQSEESFVTVDENDYSWDEAYDERAPRARSGGDEIDNKLDALYNSPDRAESLQEMLAGQLVYLELPPRLRRAAERVIYSLENDGYLRVAPEELVDPEEDDPLAAEELEEALGIVQHLDPPGVGARSLRECFLLQIRAMPGYPKGYHDFEYRMIEEHLDDLAANRLPKVAKAMDCDIDDVKAVVEFLRGLNPRPGLAFGPEESLRVAPDVVITHEDGEFRVELNTGGVPSLRVSESCKQAMKAEKGQTDAKKYLKERLMSADWIVAAIEQRKRTLLNVSKAIVRHQGDYLLGQTSQPGPLMMQTIADEVEIDISTVSRAVKDKYADTPVGLVALRDMFTREVGGTGGGSGGDGGKISNVQIMERIRRLVDEEDPANPLKDAQIVNLLKAEGVKIVRRTVAKYRQNLGILPHRQRKQY